MGFVPVHAPWFRGPSASFISQIALTLGQAAVIRGRLSRWKPGLGFVGMNRLLRSCRMDWESPKSVGGANETRIRRTVYPVIGYQR